MFVLPPCTVRRMIKTVGELQRKVASWGHQVSKTTIRRHLHANKLFGRLARKKPFLSFYHKHKRLEFTQGYWNFDWNRVVWSDETKMLVWHKKKNSKTENNLYVWWRWRFHDVVGMLFLQGPENLVRVHGIMNAMKYESLNLNLVASARKLKLGRRISLQDNRKK